MTATRTVDVSGLPPFSISNKSPLWWGQFMMCLIESSMFLMMIAIYFYVRLSVDVWPPPGTQLPHVGLATLALIPLVLSAGGSYLAGEAAKKNNAFGMLAGMLLNITLGGMFLVLQFMVVRTFNFTWTTDVHGSIVWAILFLHTLDAVADLIYTSMLLVIVAVGRYGQKQRIGVHVDSVVWYFIVAIWFPLYGVIFWGPRLVGAPQ